MDELKRWEVKLYAEGAATLTVNAVDEHDAEDIVRDIVPGFIVEGGSVQWELESVIEQ